ncbi:cytochrome P450 [Amycolatopsis alkalitolerans]|uniref:Cytochrome P450 n=1 Tax=Amycolatopsis alkalitolerans TaxID=2547244 RepID=A0A5C4LQL5_9PSEU|nr:cytochrome P450 [Amycolatopsis alkalitolerans]TNC18718.1 cytochrome P450 [Amycolatopsis alkalitolerans]
MTQVKSPDSYELFAEGTLREPHEFWASLRSQCPVFPTEEGIGYYVISRYADVTAVLRDTETFSSELSRRFKGGVSAYEDSPAVKEVLADACPYVGTLNFTDGPRHAAQRRAVRRGFTVARVRALEELISNIVDELLDDLPSNEEVDIVPRLSVPLPVRVITHILGLDADKAAQVKRWGDAQVARFGHPRESEEENLEIARTIVEMHQYIIGQLEAREKEPRDDFLSDLLAGAEGVSRQELVLICAQLIVAGAESTASMISSLIDQLVDHPDQLAALRADRSLIPDAVEETLRFESPIKAAYRFTTRDVEIGGSVIPANSVCLVLLGSADRDDDVYDSAGRFDISTTEGRPNHVAFGMGAHLCSGAALARAEGRIVLEKLLDRTSDIRRIRRPEPRHEADLTVRSLHSLPLVFVTAT